MDQPNWIADTNRFSLERPPEWWLRRLRDFDSSLVVIPSRQQSLYRLAQRRPLSLPESVVNDALFKESDTQMLASYSLIPVTSIKAQPRWDNPDMWRELSDRAPWRNGGAEEVIKHIEANEAKQALDKQFATDDMLNILAKDAWGYYGKMTGTRSHMWTPRTTPIQKSDIVSRKTSAAVRVK